MVYNQYLPLTACSSLSITSLQDSAGSSGIEPRGTGETEQIERGEVWRHVTVVAKFLNHNNRNVGGEQQKSNRFILAKTIIMMRRWNLALILVRGISRFLSAVCRRWFPGQSGDRTYLVLYERLVICLTRPFQLLPLVENFSHHLPGLRPATVYIFLWFCLLYFVVSVC